MAAAWAASTAAREGAAKATIQPLPWLAGWPFCGLPTHSFSASPGRCQLAHPSNFPGTRRMPGGASTAS
jgi:hypothetical protein